MTWKSWDVNSYPIFRHLLWDMTLQMAAFGHGQLFLGGALLFNNPR
jgi:hypothetical protein